MALNDATARAYLVRNPCGCLAGLIMDLPDNPARTAREVARELRAGRHVERVTVEVARLASWQPCVGNPECVAAPRARKEAP